MNNVRKIPSLQDFQTLQKPIRNINIEHKEKLTPLEKFALWITEWVGTMEFFLIIFGWTIVWLLWNISAPEALRFDPFPAFVLWLFISNVFQLFLLPLIMIGQNFLGRHAEERAEADFEVNSMAEQEIEAILMHLENQNSLTLEILRRLDKSKEHKDFEK